MQNKATKQENNRQQILLDLLNQLENDNCIITISKSSDFLPAVFKWDTKYQIYINQFSQFRDYDNVDELIKTMLIYISADNFIEYKIISHDEFYQIRLRYIRKDITSKLDNIDAPENATLKDIIYNVERDLATYVIMYDEVKYLIGAVSNDEDFYYMCLIQKKGEVQVEFSSCVGHYVPLHRYLPAEEYEKVKDYVIEKAISDKNLKETETWLCNKISNATDYVPFTKISIKKGENWYPFQFENNDDN